MGFLDDDEAKKGKTIHGLPIIGNINELKSFVIQYEISKVFIAIPSLSSGSKLRSIINSCDGTNVEFRTLPGIADIIDDKVSFSQLRQVESEDLLGRKEVNLDTVSVEKMLHDKVVLVTGAGGSIGSELCRQILKFHPKKLVIFEQSEFGLFSLEKDLMEKFPRHIIVPFIGDVRNKERVHAVFEEHLPSIVFHAAAYKHVPLMEQNSIEAVFTNIQGTYNVTNAACEFKSEKFVLISTDKAVNPTNVMGASKRIAEMVVQNFHIDANSGTKLMMVRFGNVLGSSGSVIPTFKKQIEKGGPVTVTHKDITRYFMTIPEACLLVLQAGTIGNGGEVFVLDMGEPVKIMDLARELIALSGLVPEVDIEIKVTGLRPGEKLYEEMFFEGEGILSTPHPLVKIAKAKGPGVNFNDQLDTLFKLSSTTRPEVVRQLFMSVLDEYKPENTTLEINEPNSIQ